MSGEYTLYGGNGVKIKTLDATADGTYTASEGEAYGTVNVSASGGSTGGDVLVVHADSDGVLDKKWQEITDADFAVIVYPPINGVSNREFVIRAATDGVNWSVTAIAGSAAGIGAETYYADSADGYPVLD